MFSLTAASALSAVAMHPGWHGPWGGGGWWLFLLIPLFWFVVIVVLASIFGRRWRRRAWEGHQAMGGYGPPWAWRQNQAVQSAEQTLAERFARGDIDEIDYRARLEVLRTNNPTPPAPPTR
ncbi:SHOCT domain-containing protein [Plantibacter sp. YIM 135249]|uniref:SHOCT domain-containing protein n=1 Tax=Plantibacter sp. YIM 135249 TaxID=3423918 RepID=UPI003D3478B8